jgi:hypothetical protein
MTSQPALAPRRRRWPVLLPVALVLALAGAWCGFWFYAAQTAEEAIAGWREREAKSGRIFTCGGQSIGGFPFRIEVRCPEAVAEFTTLQPPLTLKTTDLLVAAQVYQPTLLIAEASGPLTIGESGRAPTLLANWSLAQASVRGTPAAPERVSIVIEQPVLDRMGGGTPERLVTAKRSELHGRIAAGSVTDNPVIDIGLRALGAVAPGWHPVMAQPLDIDIASTLRGLKDFSPKPWSARLRDLQAAGGRIEITRARLQQGDAIAVGAGTLGLTPEGRLEGQLRITATGLEKVLPAFGVDRLAPPGSGVDRLAGALDRLAPGLGNVARQQAGVGLAAGIMLLGEQTELEGRKAVSLPLRFTDGNAFLGPIPLGRTPPLF